ACTRQDFVWVVVDNGSTNGSVREITGYLQRQGRDFTLVNEGGKPALTLKAGQGLVYALKENYGFAKGNNLGIALVEEIARARVCGGESSASAEPSHYLLLNNDTLVEPDFLVKLEDFAAAHPQYVALTPQIRLAEPPDRIWNCGGRLFFGLRKYLYGGKRVTELEKSRHARKRFININLITGCALFASRGLLGNPDAWLRGKSKKYAQTPHSPTDDTDLLTNRFFFGEEDFDFSLRMQETGRKMACVLDSVIYHKDGISRARFNKKRQIYTYYLNRFIDVRQHYSKMLFFLWIKLYPCYIKALMVRNGIAEKEAVVLLRRLHKEAFRREGVSKEVFLNAGMESRKQ
ncbi:MAG: hypothetical protein NC324_08725, partial [Bacteroides sp.]|nr:hypothetical protein [Bacteroides sp.]